MKKSTTKRALLSSVLALVMCFGMLTGTTFAWFTDTVTSGTNIIAAGNLDVELYHNTNEVVDSNTKLFDDVDSDLWEPGAMAYEVLTVANKGSLALKYQLTLNALNATVIDGVSFASKLKVAVVETTGYTYDRATIVADTSLVWTDLATFTLDGELAATNDTETYGIIIWWQPSDNDNLFNMNNGKTDTVSVDVGVNLFATQLSSESDAFGNDYDAEAPIVSAPVARPTTGTAINLKGAEDVAIGLPADVVENLPAGVTEIGLSVSEPVVDAAANTITFASIELVDQNGDVIDLEALNTNTNITVTLPAQTTFAPGETVVLYHDGEYVATAVVNADTTITYEVAHLCEVSVGAVEVPAEKNGVVAIANAAQLFGFAQEVNSGKNYYEGKTVVLTADIDLKNAEWTPIGSMAKDHGFMGNFNGNGKTISNLSITNIAVDADGSAYAGFFGLTEGDAGAENVIENLTIKNVTINTKGDIVAAAIAYPYYTTLKNITVCGDIAIKGGNYTSGVLAYTRRCTTASNITVNGNKGSYITGAQTVGGVISDIQMNGGLTANYSNFSASNLTITGTKMVGGISGIISKQTLDGATVENVELVCSDSRVGVIAGCVDSKPVINNVEYTNVTGTTSIVGASYDSASKAYVVIDGVECAANAAAFKEQLSTGTVNLAGNIVLNETITIANGQTVVINLNGNTISGTFEGTGNKEMFLVKGNLTVTNGNIELTATQNQGWGAMSTIFDITAGGVVTLDKVVAENKGGTDMNFVAHLNNWGTASLNVTDSTLKATYVAVRVFNSGYDMNNVTIKNSTLSTTGNAAFWVHNYTVADFGSQDKADAQAKLLNFTFENNKYVAAKAAFRYGFTNEEYYSETGAQVVSTADELVAALANGKDVIFANDITMAAKTTNGYGVTGIVVDGQTINGNGHTFKVTGAGTTWDSAIYIKGGKIENLNITGAMRGVFMGTANADVYLEKVSFGTIYTFNSDGGNKNFGVYISNSTMNGWTSHSNVHKEVVYTNCVFTEGSGYKYCRPYGPTKFIDCTFTEGFTVDKSQTTELVFENCIFE